MLITGFLRRSCALSVFSKSMYVWMLPVIFKFLPHCIYRRTAVCLSASLSVRLPLSASRSPSPTLLLSPLRFCPFVLDRSACQLSNVLGGPAPRWSLPGPGVSTQLASRCRDGHFDGSTCQAHAHWALGTLRRPRGLSRGWGTSVYAQIGGEQGSVGATLQPGRRLSDCTHVLT